MKLIIASRKFTKAKIRNMVQAKIGTPRKPTVNPPKLQKNILEHPSLNDKRRIKTK